MKYMKKSHLKEQKSIYLLHYAHSQNVIYSIGVIKYIEDDN